MGTQVSKYSDMSLFSVNPILGGEITEREKKKKNWKTFWDCKFRFSLSPRPLYEKNKQTKKKKKNRSIRWYEENMFMVTLL